VKYLEVQEKLGNKNWSVKMGKVSEWSTNLEKEKVREE